MLQSPVKLMEPLVKLMDSPVKLMASFVISLEVPVTLMDSFVRFMDSLVMLLEFTSLTEEFVVESKDPDVVLTASSP